MNLLNPHGTVARTPRSRAWRPAALLAFVLGAGAAVAASAADYDVVVAADGTGRFKTIREAIDAAPALVRDDGRRWRILIKRGIYHELVYVQREKRFLTLIGEDAEKTVLSYDLYSGLPGPDGKPMGAFRTATLTVDADDFRLENVTVENFSGPKGQALALRVDGDRVVFRGCHFLGWQGTVLVNRGRHYFSQCVIKGTVDLIFGGATAYFERCTLLCAGHGYVTAASTPDTQRHGLVFSFCTIEGERPEVRTYLGRPWRAYAKAVYLNTQMSDVVHRAGWDNGKKPRAEATVFFAEFESGGPGGQPDERVKWSKQLTAAEAANYSIANVLGGADGWNPLYEPAPAAGAASRRRQR